MWKVAFFLLYFGLFTISIGGQINSDPAPGRSPGPPGMNTIEDDHGVVGESPTLLLTKDDNYPDNSNENTKVITEKEDSKINNQDVLSTPDSKIIHPPDGSINYELNYGSSADESEQQPDSPNIGVPPSTAKHSDEDFADNLHEGYDRGVNKIVKSSAEEASPNSLCKNKLSDYLHAGEKIVNIDDVETNSSDDDHHQHLPSFDINIEVLHEKFETGSGITCGLMYKVHLWTNVSSVVNDFFVETMTDGKERGSFVGEILSNKLPISWFKSPFVKETKWALEKYPKRSSWDVDSEEENVLQPIGRWTDPSKFAEDETSRKSEMICNTNKWTGAMKGQSKTVAFWILNEFCDKDDNIEFRLFFRSSNKTGIVFKKSFTTMIKPDCELFLKRSTGNLDYTSLPLYNLDCTVFFPSHEEVSFPQPPGILIELVRLNVPCDSGGYIQFSERSRLCGKLEELSVNERTYHFDLNQNSSVKIHKSPMFSLRYQLVDYCYNMTLVNRNGSFFIQPVRETLECYFRIHLPYGYRIDLNLITNNDSDLHQGDKFTNEATYENLRVNLMSHINFSFSNNSNKLTDKSTNNFPADGECSGILFSVHDTKLYKWSHCVNENSAMKGFSLVSQSNTLEIEVLKTKSATAQNPFSRYSETTERTEAKMTKLPTLFFTYSAKPVLDIVSDCAFGWVAVQQFCMSTVETAMSWHQGEQFCASQGGHLASIRSDIEQRTIDQLLINSPGYQDHYAYWVGGSDKNFEGDFRWTDGLPFQYTNWFPGWSQHGHYNKQPNDDGLSGQDCIELRRYFRTPPGAQTSKTPLSNTFMWNDRDCNAQNFVICERAMTEVSIQKNWANDCNKTVSLTKEHPKASLWSPSFPRQYPDNANCYTTVTAPSGYRIVLEFEELVIENEPGCSYDYLEITEPTSTHANAKGSSDPTRVPRHGLRKNTYRKRNSYENIGLTGNFEIAQASYQNLLNIFSNLYKPRANFLIQTPDYPRGNPLYPTTKLHETLPKRMCGDWSSKLKLLRYVSVGSYLGLHFVSDYSHHFGGFKAKVYMENRGHWFRAASECSDERLKPYNGSCYLFVSYPEVEWWTAQQVCRGISAQLSSISSPDEHRFITTSIRNQVDYSPQLIYWLGGELTTNRTFEWSDGSRMIFQGWLPGQGQFDELPSESTCLGLQWKMSPTPMLPSGLYWDAQRCRRMGGYVCKKRQQPFDQFELKNETIRGVEGRLTSHGYPNPYPLNIDYWVHIIAPERRRIIMQFQKIDLESQDECLYDYVSIQNYETASKISLEPGANPIPMAMLTSDKNYDEMQYQTYKLQQHGRHVRSAADGPANENFITESASRNKLKKFDIPHSNPPKQKIEFYSRETLDTSRKNFNEIQLNRKRKRKKYDNRQEMLRDDSYHHRITKRNTINPEVDNAQSFLPYVRWCGSHEADMSKFDFVSASNEAILNFHSDYSVSGLGFAAIWKAIDISGCPLQTLTSREGTVTSSNYPYFLINNLDCTYVIQAPLGGKVWLEFTDFEILEESFLYIDIGNGPFQPFLVRDHLNEGIFVSLKEQIRIQIRTGQKPRGRGFRATFKTVGPFVKDRVIKFSTNSTGYLFPLNHPQIMPGNIDFTQHFMAPLGEIILLELYGVEFSQNGCPDYNILEVYDNYADNNGTRWQLCKYQNHSSVPDTTTGKDYSNYVEPQQAPVYITSYLNTIHIRQKTTTESHINLNATIRVQPDVTYKLKLASGDDLVESCQPNPCQYKGKCITNGRKKRCQCHGHYTGRFCGLNMCELEPCLFGKCELTTNNFKCHCQPGYIGQTCEQKQKPCADNPCEGRGECFPKNGGFVCRCHAWWEGQRCERRMMHIPYKPLSDRMLQEPFWLGLITVFVVLAVIGLVWCAKRHFPEKIEKLLAEEADRNRPPGAIHGHHHHTSLREQLQFTTSIPQTTATTPGAPRSIFNRLGIRKPSILSLSSPNPPGGATARTFSLDDLLRPPPRRSPSPRKKRNNSTPTKKNAAEKKQILQQLVSPATTQVKPKISLGELIQMSENRLKVTTLDSESDVKETTFSENSASGSTSTARAINDPKLEKKVTFARLLSKVSAEMSSGSEVEAGNGTQNSSALSLPTEIQYRANSVPPSPCTNDIRSPHSTSSNQGSDSLSSSELALTDLGLRNINSRRVRPKVSSADSILAMFRNFATTAGSAPTSSVFISPSTTPTASSPQDDVPGDDDSSTSSMHTPVSFSSGAPDSPVFYRQTTIEVPVLDALSAHKSAPNTNLLHPPTILLEIPSNGINKCLSPIRELPTPMPSPALTPIMPRLQRTISPSSQDDPLSGSYSDDEDKSEQQMAANIISELHKEMNRIDSEVDTTPTDATTPPIVDINKPPPLKIRAAPKLANIMIDIEPPTPDEKTPRPRDLVIPTLTVEQPSPTKNRFPMIIFPGSPPPQRASIGETSFMFPNKQQQKRLLKQFEKPTSLDLPFTPPTITVTSNMSELESDAEPMSPAPNKMTGATTLLAPGNPVGMCYLSPFAICTRADRTISESNLSSSGYSSMASPGPSRCGSSNPLCPNEMDESGSGPPGSGLSLHANLLSRRQNSVLASCKENITNGKSSNNGSAGSHDHLRGRSDSETLSDDALLESNDEGIGTDHLEEKVDDGEGKAIKELEVCLEKDLIESGKNVLGADEVITMAQLQLPSIVIQADGSDRGLSPVSSRSESPLSERAGMGRFSPHFYGRKDQQLPFTDSDGLYDFPSSDGKGASITHQRRSSKKRERKPSKTGPTQSPTKNLHLDLPSKDTNQPGIHNCSKHFHHLHHPHHGTTITTRKSPKRRPIQRHPIASSSSSSESLTSARELTLRAAKRACSPGREKCLRKRPDGSEDDTDEDVSSQILPNAHSDEVARPRKISRLRAIGNQIRFLRRLEQSIRKRDKLLSPSDSCPEDGNDDLDSPRITSPLLQQQLTPTNKPRTSLCRQKRLPTTSFTSAAIVGERGWRGRGKNIVHGEINSD